MPNQLCDCKTPLIMSSSRHCGNCGLLRPQCADPVQRAQHSVGSAAEFAKRVSGQPYGRGGTLTDPDQRARAHLREPTADNTRRPDVHEFPAMMTGMNPDQFKAWLDGPGRLFIVYLPGGKAFPIKVPDEQHQFFVAMLTQLRIHLGGDVQAQSATPVTNPPPLQQPPAPGTPPPAIPDVRITPLRKSCPGSGQAPIGSTVRGRHCAPNGALQCPGRACCKVCGRELKLTNAGTIRLHRDRTNEED